MAGHTVFFRPASCGALLALLAISAHAQQTHEHSTVLLMRHGEKTAASGNGLSPEGIARAQYLARCLGTDELTRATPIGPVRAVIASATREGKSHRPRDTVRPLAEARGLLLRDSVDKKDFAGLERVVRGSLVEDGTTVIAWQHEELPGLLLELAPDLSLDDSFADWPARCDAASWPEPKHLKGGKCYDLVWQLTMRRRVGEGHDGWTAASVAAHQMGFGGAPTSPCVEGFTPLAGVGGASAVREPRRGAAGFILDAAARLVATGGGHFF